MSDSELARAVEDRMVKWAKMLMHAHSTPFILIGMGHDHMQGRVQTYIEDGCTIQQAVEYLEKTVQLLRSKM